MYIQPMAYEKIVTITEKRASSFDDKVNKYLSKGWVIITMDNAELQTSEFGSSRDMFLIAQLGKMKQNGLELK